MDTLGPLLTANIIQCNAKIQIVYATLYIFVVGIKVRCQAKSWFLALGPSDRLFARFNHTYYILPNTFYNEKKSVSAFQFKLNAIAFDYCQLKMFKSYDLGAGLLLLLQYQPASQSASQLKWMFYHSKMNKQKILSLMSRTLGIFRFPAY